jgi:hypothetical protein
MKRQIVTQQQIVSFKNEMNGPVEEYIETNRYNKSKPGSSDTG